MKDHIEELLSQALLHLRRDGILPKECDVIPQVERTRSPEHGEFASNLAMVLAREARKPPRELAGDIVERLPKSRQVDRVELAGPGFINFFIDPLALSGVVRDILRKNKQYGHAPKRPDHGVTVEFVSANPTGPLHVGHGRGAAYGASLASLLAAAGSLETGTSRTGGSKISPMASAICSQVTACGPVSV